MSKKVYYRLELTSVSPLALSSGENEYTDKDVFLDSRKKPMIPATSFAGVVRSFVHQLNSEAEKEIFGFTEENSQKGQDSKVKMYDFQCTSETNDFFISKRDMVALKDKVGIKGAKFDMQVVETGAKFVGFVELGESNSKYEEILEKAFDGIAAGQVRFGGKTTRGYGQMDVTVKKKVFDVPSASWLDFDMYEDKCWQDVNPLQAKTTGKGLGISLKLHLKGGLSIREYSTEVNAPDFVTLGLYNNGKERIPVIPGTSWSGAFRSRFSEFAGEDLTNDTFGYVKQDKDGETKMSKVSFSESRIAGGEHLEMTRNSLDRFTSGTKDGALFTERTYFFGNTDLNIQIPDYCQGNEIVLQNLILCIFDLDQGLLSVGGLTSIGRGLFEIEQAIISFEEKETDVTSYVKSLDVKGLLKEVLK